MACEESDVSSLFARLSGQNGADPVLCPQNKLFVVRGVCIVDVLADLKVIEDMVNSLGETLVAGASNSPGRSSLFSASVVRSDTTVRFFAGDIGDPDKFACNPDAVSLRRRVGESYKEWGSRRQFNDACLCSSESYQSMRMHLSGRFCSVSVCVPGRFETFFRTTYMVNRGKVSRCGVSLLLLPEQTRSQGGSTTNAGAPGMVACHTCSLLT